MRRRSPSPSVHPIAVTGAVATGAAALLALAAVAAVLALAVPSPAAAQDGRPEHAVRYRPPVAGPVADPFRPPATPYGPGNRGLEYATVPGSPVVAAADGRVTFAGPVAGARHVTVLHADGLRTTYAFLADIVVGAGDRVAAGQVVGRAGDRLLWTARLGDAYLDPAVLLAASRAGDVRLVPDRRTPATGSSGPGAGRTARSSAGRPTRPRTAVSAAAVEWALGPGP